MNLQNGIPSVVEGIAFYPHLLIANERFKPAFYEVSLAVSDETFDQFKSRGYVSCFPAGDRDFTPDPVISFRKFAYNKNGTANPPPKLIDLEGNPVDVSIGNGSKMKIQWKHSEYKGGEKGIVKRPMLVAAQLVELVEYNGESGAAFEDAALEF